ncbi:MULTISPECIES: MFS transporter [unclassified Marinobacter]|uniref:MFS transporter n=1 Tax=unclassified Marinobacter TaxID=83889 RepID=UPI00192884AC|nr:MULTISPECIES: MFS transporter [unclassified Marinobacter]MBL3827205.1 MFS transporter [Marinobacter sp. MC3]MBL3895705.1 MFS transporter [Marinobacter sp. MW3]
MRTKALIATLALATFSIGADEYVLGPLFTPIGEDFGIPPAQVAWLISSFALPYALLAPFFGALADQVGRKNVMIPGLVLFVLATCATALSTSFTWALLSRVVTGAAAAAIMPTVFATISDNLKGSQQLQAMGVVQLGLTLGLILSPAIGSYLVVLANWRSSFWAISLIALVTLLFCLLLFPSERRANTLKTDEKLSWPLALSQPGVFPALTMMMLGLGVAVGTYAIVGELLRSRYDYSTGQVGMVMASFGATTIIGNLLVGPLHRLFHNTITVIAAGMLCVAAGIGTVTLTSELSFTEFWIAGACWMIGGGFAAPALQSLLGNLDDRNKGLILASGSSCLNLGIMAMTGLEGWLLASVGREAVGLVAVASVLCSILLLLNYHKFTRKLFTQSSSSTL